jgi:anti-sigma-K factor RskA
MTRPTNEPNSADLPNSSDLVAGYILNDLSPEEAARLNQVLAETPELQQEIAAFSEAFSLITYDLPIVEPSPELKARILNAASQSISSPISSSNVIPMVSERQSVITTTSRPRWQRWIPAISTGIAAISIAALGLTQVQMKRQAQQTIALQQQLNATNTELQRLQRELQANQATIARLSQPDTQMYALTDATSNSNNRPAKARIFAKPGDRAVTLVAQDLPKLPDSQIYRLWAVATPTAAPMYCGEFRQDDSGTAQWVAPDAACTNKPLKYLITQDAPTDPTTSAGPLVMRSLS